MTSPRVATLDRPRTALRETGRRPASRVNVGRAERWASLIGGAALAVYGFRRRDIPGLLLAVAGGELLYRGTTGHCHTYGALGVSTADGGEGGVATLLPATTKEIRRSVTINRPREELYRFWRNFENLPQFMQHLESVTPLGDRRSHWVAKAPAGRHVEWDAEIVEERENELIAWRAVEGSEIANAGSVRFQDAPGGRGTEVHVAMTVEIPGGRVGEVMAKLFGEEPDQQVRDDLRRFKQLMEAGEIPTTEGQPSGRRRAQSWANTLGDVTP